MPTAASIIDSSQFPLEFEPLMISGRQTVRSMVAQRPEFAQVPS